MHRLDLFPKNELVQQYRKVFSARDGLDVLAHMLYDLGVFQQIGDGNEEIALKNYGTRLLQILGGGEPHEDSTKQFVKKLMKQTLPKEQTDE